LAFGTPASPPGQEGGAPDGIVAFRGGRSATSAGVVNAGTLSAIALSHEEGIRLENTGIAVERFVALAAEYCDFIERLDELTGRAFVQTSVRLLPALYIAALELPHIEPGSSNLIEDAKSGADDYRTIYGRISDKLGALTLYWEVFDPYEEDAPVCGSIADDLADIYGDLKGALKVYQQGSESDRKDAVWHWRFNFHFHWGEHLVDALRALHRAQASRPLGEEIESVD